MSDNYTKLSLQSSLGAMATARAMAEIERTGRALPCSVTAVNPNGLGYSFVAVKFEIADTILPPLILPKQESQWLRAPTQVGDFGMTVPADTYTGGISGFDGVADLTVDYGNMSTLLWVPCGSSTFAASPDPNKAWVNGPMGAILSDAMQTASVVVAPNMITAGTGNSSVVVTPTAVTATAAGNMFVLNATGLTITVGGKVWTFTAAGFTDSGGVIEETHQHGLVQSGTSFTGPRVV